ncbi:hypothetical protein YPPY66_2306, partial [Yersinia pestis PY-66]
MGIYDLKISIYI